MSPNQHIRRARIDLGLSEEDVATRARLTIYELGDLELHSDEFCSAIAIENALLLCSVLDLSIFEVIGMAEGHVSTLLPINEHVKYVRELANIGAGELDEELGYKNGFIKGVENCEIDLIKYPVELVVDIAKFTKSSAFEILYLLKENSNSDDE